MKINYDKEILSVDIYERGWIAIGGTSFSFSGQCSKSENKTLSEIGLSGMVKVDFTLDFVAHMFAFSYFR